MPVPPKSLKSQKSQAVIVGLSGGLGNQMFQYAAGRALSLRLKAPLQLDTTWFLGRKSRSYALGKFSIEENIVSSKLPGPEILKSLESRLSRKLGLTRMGVQIFREPHFHFSQKFVELKHPVYLEGYWQSERYFDIYRDVIFADFSARYKLPEKCKDIRQQICESDSVCVHIRRGDYVHDSSISKVYAHCSSDYYQKALAIAVSGLAKPQAFVFSDDPEWVQANFPTSISTTVVDINSSNEAWWDLFLMTACRSFVIANSSLSWWAAWLGSGKNKTVICPRKWFLDSRKCTKDLIPNTWIIL